MRANKIIVPTIAILAMVSATVHAQNYMQSSWPDEEAPIAAEPPEMLPPGTVPPQATSPAVSPQQIDQLVAPIALYPDQLVSQILMASTYPLEIVEASRWLQQPGNGQMEGDPLASAIEGQPWDPSVKSLVAFPQVLSMLNNNLQWTEQLGNAFLSNQPAVMDSVQRLRQRAQAQGNLTSTPQQVVSSDQGEIIIQPAQPEVVYVPVYNPTVVYGPWPYPSYPPYYFPPPPNYYYASSGIINFGIGIGIIDAFWGWDHWDWHRHRIDIDDRRFEDINRGRPPVVEGRWEHDPDHRHGVPYSGPTTQARFQSREDTSRHNNFRGFSESPQSRVVTPQAQEQQQIQQQRHDFQRQQVRQPQEAAHRDVQHVQQQQEQQRQQVQQQQREMQFQRQQIQQPQVQHQHQAPVFESFSRGSEVRAQSQRGFNSRSSMPAATPPQVQPAHANNNGGHRGGGDEHGNRGGDHGDRGDHGNRGNGGDHGGDNRGGGHDDNRNR